MEPQNGNTCFFHFFGHGKWFKVWGGIEESRGDSSNTILSEHSKLSTLVLLKLPGGLD